MASRQSHRHLLSLLLTPNVLCLMLRTFGMAFFSICSWKIHNKATTFWNSFMTHLRKPNVFNLLYKLATSAWLVQDRKLGIMYATYVAGSMICQTDNKVCSCGCSYLTLAAKLIISLSSLNCDRWRHHWTSNMLGPRL